MRGVKILKDRETGQSRGFGFIQIDGSAEEAVANTSGKLLHGRPLRVEEAKQESGGNRGTENRRPPPQERRRGGSRDDHGW